MTDAAFLPLTIAAIVGSGLMAGVFFAFSTFVMAALARLPPAQGVAAMQAINVTVINPLFMLGFLGTGAVCAALVAGGLLWWDSRLAMAGALVYLVGCLGLTMARNVPLNDALAVLTPGTPDAAALWARYLAEWTWWNHLRTVAPVVSMVLFALALAR